MLFRSYQQAITAGGMGCKAAIDADEYLKELERTESAATDADTAAADD